MALFHVQDVDRPLWVIALDYLAALAKWKNQIALENPGDDPGEPEGISKIADDDEVIL